MARGDKSSYTGKQKRQAHHIEEGYEKRGVSKDEAERRAYATVNKESGGGKKSGSGRGKSKSSSSRSSSSRSKSSSSSSHHGGFKKGSRKAKEAGRKGGKAAHRS